MRNRTHLRLQLERLERLTMLSAAMTPLAGTADGTFFAHEGSARTGTVYSLFASGNIPSAGPTVLVGGFETAGFTVHGAGGGNLVFGLKSRPGNLFLRMTELKGPAARSTGEYLFQYQITGSSGASRGASRSGTLAVTLQPIDTNIHGEPVSNPGFFGNATLTFE